MSQYLISKLKTISSNKSRHHGNPSSILIALTGEYAMFMLRHNSLSVEDEQRVSEIEDRADTLFMSLGDDDFQQCAPTFRILFDMKNRFSPNR